MLLYVHRLSAVFFYLLCASFFIAWVLIRNDISANASATWMQIADMPLTFCAVVYGGLSLYLSLRHEDSKILLWLIGVPLAVFFLLILILNFAF